MKTHWLSYLCNVRVVSQTLILRSLCLCGILGCLAACSPDYEHLAEQRLIYAQQAKINGSAIDVAVIANITGPEYVQGAQLAAEQINQRPGKLLHRELRLHIKATDSGGFEGSRSKILDIASDPKIVAVLGHGASSVAIPASVIYERSKVVFICSFSTSQAFTRHNFQYVFRMVPGNPVLASQITNIAKTLGYQKMVVLHARDTVNRELAFLFEDKAVKNDIQLVKRASFFANTQDYRSIVSSLTKIAFDAVFLAAPTRSAARVAEQLREMGLNQPILGGDTFYAAEYGEAAGLAANNSIAPTIYKMNKTNPMNWEFAQAYKKKYNREPNRNAAQGYDSVRLLAVAIERNQSTVASSLSSTLHYMPPFAGVTGVHAFDASGDVQGKKYLFQVWRDEKLHDLPAIQQFYLLDDFVSKLRKKRGKDYKFTPFLKTFTQLMPDEDHKVYLLDLAYEMLQFKRIGIIYENTQEGKKIAHYNILKKAAKRKGFEVIECKIPFSFLNKEQIKQRLFNCYGTLSLKMDALFVSSYYDMGPEFIGYLHNSLKFYKIPSIAFSARENMPNISVLLGKRTDIQSGQDSGLGLYRELLNNIKTYQFSERLSSLPEVIIRLDDLQDKNLDRPVDVYL